MWVRISRWRRKKIYIHSYSYSCKRQTNNNQNRMGEKECLWAYEKCRCEETKAVEKKSVNSILSLGKKMWTVSVDWCKKWLCAKYMRTTNTITINWIPHSTSFNRMNFSQIFFSFFQKTKCFFFLFSHFISVWDVSSTVYPYK